MFLRVFLSLTHCFFSLNRNTTTIGMQQSSPKPPLKPAIATHNRSKTASTSTYPHPHSPHIAQQHSHQRGVSFAMDKHEDDCKAKPMGSIMNQSTIVATITTVSVTTFTSTSTTTSPTPTPTIQMDRFVSNKRGTYGIARAVSSEWTDDADEWNTVLV